MNSWISGDHLSDEQFSELLIGGSLTEDGRRHLSECEACRHEAEKFTDSVGMFRSTSLAWSETKQKKARRIVAGQAVRLRLAPIGWALAAALVIVVGVPTWNDHHENAQVSSSSARSGPADSAAEIASDNQLMQSVNLALNTSEASPVAEYHLLDRSLHSRTTARPQ